MDENKYHSIFLAKELKAELAKVYKPPDEGFKAENDQIIPMSVVKGTRGYIEKVVNQINGCFEKGWSDACAVMVRRLIETLIIEVFENKKIDDKIKNSQGDFLPLDDLIDKILIELSWNLSRNTKGSLPKLKKIGDLSAHNRRFNAHFKDLEIIRVDIRVVVGELLSLASLK
jgi:hypothetical protein